jgi:hypothetical protein
MRTHDHAKGESEAEQGAVTWRVDEDRPACLMGDWSKLNTDGPAQDPANAVCVGCGAIVPRESALALGWMQRAAVNIGDPVNYGLRAATAEDVQTEAWLCSRPVVRWYRNTCGKNAT